jgi:hypothetical protein
MRTAVTARISAHTRCSQLHLVMPHRFSRRLMLMGRVSLAPGVGGPGEIHSDPGRCYDLRFAASYDCCDSDGWRRDGTGERIRLQRQCRHRLELQNRQLPIRLQPQLKGTWNWHLPRRHTDRWSSSRQRWFRIEVGQKKSFHKCYSRFAVSCSRDPRIPATACTPGRALQCGS